MCLLARVPRFSAWLVTLVLVASVTAAVVCGLPALQPPPPPHLLHAHGLIVAVRGDAFALRVPGHANVLWFRVTTNGHISMAHLRRHMQERAPTDVAYQAEGPSNLMAWTAD
jgi:hypothetical protein